MSKDESTIFSTFDVPLYIREETSTKIVVNVKDENTDADYEYIYGNMTEGVDYYREESGQASQDWGLRTIQIRKEEKRWGLVTWALTEDAVGKVASIKTIDQGGVQIYP